MDQSCKWLMYSGWIARSWPPLNPSICRFRKLPSVIVVLDTNIWLGELALNSSSGAAVRFFLRQRNARLALPEVVRLEVERNFREKLNAFVANVRDNHRQLLAVFGKLKEVVLPDKSAIENKVAQIFSGVGVELLNVEFSLASAKDSFLKTINKVPPSDQSQQFKDGVLWADCVYLLQEDDVFLVTSDSDFFQERKPEKGLAKNLLSEAEGKPHQLKVFRSLGELLADIETEVSLDESTLVRSFMERHSELVEGMMQRNGFRLEQMSRMRKALYATENPTVLYIEFNIDMACADLSDQERTDAVLHLAGTGSYHTEERIFSDMRITGQELDYVLSDGTSKQSVNVILAAANIVIGHKDVTHTVRYKIAEEHR
jgi:hypothetical protein